MPDQRTTQAIKSSNPQRCLHKETNEQTNLYQCWRAQETEVRDPRTKDKENPRHSQRNYLSKLLLHRSTRLQQVGKETLQKYSHTSLAQEPHTGTHCGHRALGQAGWTRDKHEPFTTYTTRSAVACRHHRSGLPVQREGSESRKRWKVLNGEKRYGFWSISGGQHSTIVSSALSLIHGEVDPAEQPGHWSPQAHFRHALLLTSPAETAWTQALEHRPLLHRFFLWIYHNCIVFE